MKKIVNLKKAFTLAEVLITLSIIGVVAALTIPALIQRTGDEEIIAKLNKVYSVLSQAAEAVISENGGVKTWAADSKSVYEMYKEHLRNAKECGSGTKCFDYTIKHLNGSNTGWNLNTAEKNGLMLSDGIIVSFAETDKTCSLKANGSTGYCSVIRVDLTGQKGPNIIGRDIFDFVLKETGLYPRGCDSDVCIGTHGFGCTCKVIQEGKIDY